MTIDIRAALERLVELNDIFGGLDWKPWPAAIAAARLALAEPEPPINGKAEVVLEATPAEPFSGSCLSGLITGQIGYARVGSGTPTDFRWGRRNGALVLQVGYPWRQGAEHGVDWKDVPTVDLDNEAQP